MARAALQDLPASLHPRLDALRLMVSELVTNSLLHVDLAPSDRIELVVGEADGCLRVEVKNPGAGYDEALAGWNHTRDRTAPHGPSLGGYGLMVVAGMADRSGVSRGEGTVVWFEVDLDR